MGSFARLLVLAAPLLCLLGAARGTIERSPHAWSVEPEFGKSADARESLSGAACAAGTDLCIAVNDEKKYAQFFRLSGRTIMPSDIIRLLPDRVDGVKMDEIDAEGIAYVPGDNGESYFYVTGSHGASRRGAVQPSRFFLFRFPVDPKTGRPLFGFGDGDPGPQIERTAGLRSTIRNLEELADHAEQRLDRNGVTVEGVAAVEGSLLLGLRSPCIVVDGEAQAYILRVPLPELFQPAPPPATAVGLALGDNTGVRDLAAVHGGVLILAGRSDDDRGDGAFTCGEPRALEQQPGASVWFWSGRAGEEAQLLGALPGLTADDRAETLLVLEESEVAYRVLIMFDGIANGGPAEFLIRR